VSRLRRGVDARWASRLWRCLPDPQAAIAIENVRLTEQLRGSERCFRVAFETGPHRMFVCHSPVRRPVAPLWSTTQAARSPGIPTMNCSI